MGEVPGNGDGRWGGSPIGILSKPPTAKGLCIGMGMGLLSTIDGGPVLVGGGGGGGGWVCMFIREGGMPRESGRTDMPGSDEVLPLEHPDDPSEEHDELFLDCDTGDGVPSV